MPQIGDELVVAEYRDLLKSVEKKNHLHTDVGIIAKVEEYDDSYCVTTTRGSGFGGIYKPVKIVPKVGQLITFYNYQGFRVQGIDLDGKELFFKTHEELKVERQKELMKIATEKAERKQKFDSELSNPNSDFNKRLAGLPKVFRQRFGKFFRLGNGFWDLAWYELVACETALKIAYACKSWQNIRKFHKMSWDEQKAMIPSMDDGLSGNMFGFACRAAQFYLRDSKLVTRIHGALSPMVGSKPYIGR